MDNPPPIVLPENFAEFMRWMPPPVTSIISNGILDYQSRLVIFGKYKSWKSMLSMDLAFCLSTGTPWFGFSITRVPVLLVQVEIGKAAFQKRFKKYVKFHNISYTDPNYLHLLSSPYGFKFDQAYDLDKLDKWVGRQRQLLNLDKDSPQVIIIDPLFKSMSGDTNAPSEVSKFLNNIDFLILKHNCSFIIDHHERKSVIISSGVLDRGAENVSGALRVIDWCDGAIELTLLSDTSQYSEVKLTFMAMRNTEEFLEPFYIKCVRDNLSFLPVPQTVDVSIRE